jgi:hypothetical protein
MQKLQLFIVHELLPFVVAVLLLTIIFLSLLLGGLQFIFAVSNGFLMKWELVSDFPTEPTDIITYHQGILVRDTNNIVYTLKLFSSEQTEREQWFIETRDLSESWLSPSPPCTDQELPSSVYGPPPPNIWDCLHFSTGPEMGSSYIILDQDKQIWLWNNPHDSWSVLFWVILLILGTLIASPLLTIAIMNWGIRFFAYRGESEV